MECLSLLHERGNVVGIVSNGDPEPQKIKLVQSGLASYFTDRHMVFTPGGTPTAKPSPSGLLACAGSLGVPPQRCWYVGNHTTDVIAANLAGMTPILIAPGEIAARFAIEQPARTVGDLYDLHQWLAHIYSDSPDVSPTRATSAPVHT